MGYMVRDEGLGLGVVGGVGSGEGHVATAAEGHEEHPVVQGKLVRDRDCSGQGVGERLGGGREGCGVGLGLDVEGLPHDDPPHLGVQLLVLLLQFFVLGLEGFDLPLE